MEVADVDVPVDGERRVRARVAGAGPGVLLEAGGTASAVDWHPVQMLLGDEVRSCAYDRAGLGRSDPPDSTDVRGRVEDAAAVIRSLDIAPVVVVGHSYGALLAMMLAADHPTLVRGLVLVDGTGVDEVLNTRLSHAVSRLVVRVAISARAREARKYLRSGVVRPPRGKLAILSLGRFADDLRGVAADIYASKAHVRGARSEWRTVTQAIAATRTVLDEQRLPDRPMVVLTSADTERSFRRVKGLSAHPHGQWTECSSRGRHDVVPDTTHALPLDSPSTIVEAIHEILRQANRS